MLLQSCTPQIHTGTTITGRLHSDNIKSTGPNSSRPISKCSAVKACETGFNFTCQHTWMNLSFHLGHQGKPGRTNDSIKTDWTIRCGQIEAHGTPAVRRKTQVKIKPVPCIQRFHSLTNRFVLFFSWGACKKKNNSLHHRTLFLTSLFKLDNISLKE